MSILQTISDIIKGKASFSESRSPKWDKTRRAYLTTHSKCESCGSIKKLEVHHIVPFNVDPSKELDPNNLITLCECNENGINCHLNVGHNGNYKSWNVDVIKDAKRIFERITKRPVKEQ